MYIIYKHVLNIGLFHFMVASTEIVSVQYWPKWMMWQMNLIKDAPRRLQYSNVLINGLVSGTIYRNSGHPGILLSFYRGFPAK